MEHFMKVKQDYEIHDKLKSKYDKIYQIFTDCGGKTTKIEYSLEFCIILSLILYLAFSNLPKAEEYFPNNCHNFFALLPLIPLGIMIVLICLYIKLSNDKLFKPYVKVLHLKPKNASVCYSFTKECMRKEVSIEDLKSVERILIENMSMNFSISLDIFLPICLTVITNLCSDIEKIKTNIEFIIPLMFCIYAFLFIFGHNKTIKNKFFKKCIVYAEEFYNTSEKF